MIHLIGPGGAGKSTVGRLLAQRLRSRFVDLDEAFASAHGDISRFLHTHGYDRYAAQNVGVYCALTTEANRAAVLALSSGFMTYQSNIHPEYDAVRRQIASDLSTFVLVPSLDLETCVTETVRRQLTRPFARSAVREEQVIRTRFSIYINLPPVKIETMRPPADIVSAVLATLPAFVLQA